VPTPADATSTPGPTGAFVIDVEGLDGLVACLRALGYEVKGRHYATGHRARSSLVLWRPAQGRARPPVAGALLDSVGRRR